MHDKQTIRGDMKINKKDATAAPRHPPLGDGYKAALINCYVANSVLSTDDVVAAIA